jgi:hypothetical protein
MTAWTSVKVPGRQLCTGRRSKESYAAPKALHLDNMLRPSREKILKSKTWMKRGMIFSYDNEVDVMYQNSDESVIDC